jgi:hypothetical protein
MSRVLPPPFVASLAHSVSAPPSDRNQQDTSLAAGMRNVRVLLLARPGRLALAGLYCTFPQHTMQT